MNLEQNGRMGQNKPRRQMLCEPRRQMLWTDLVESFPSRILTNTRGTSVVIKNKTHFSENSTTGQPTGKKNTVDVELYDYSVLATSYKCGPCTAHATIKSQGGRGEPKTAEICRGLQLRWGANFGSPTSALSPRLRGTTPLPLKIEIKEKYNMYIYI